MAAECSHEWRPDGAQYNSFTCARCGADKLRWVEARLVVLETFASGQVEWPWQSFTTAPGHYVVGSGAAIDDVRRLRDERDAAHTLLKAVRARLDKAPVAEAREFLSLDDEDMHRACRLLVDLADAVDSCLGKLAP